MAKPAKARSCLCASGSLLRTLRKLIRRSGQSSRYQFNVTRAQWRGRSLAAFSAPAAASARWTAFRSPFASTAVPVIEAISVQSASGRFLQLRRLRSVIVLSGQRWPAWATHPSASAPRLSQRAHKPAHCHRESRKRARKLSFRSLRPSYRRVTRG